MKNRAPLVAIALLGLVMNSMAAITKNAWNFPGPTGKKVVLFRTHPNSFLWKVENESSWIGIPTTHPNYDVIVSQIMDAKRTGRGIEVFVSPDMMPTDATVFQAISVGTF